MALWEIACAYGMSVRELRRLNGLSLDRIYPGQELHLSLKQPLLIFTPSKRVTISAGLPACTR
ncbi:MAG: LysM peptidoglycan-binding domain-containing protein [Desulfobacteraceae bacterium]|nr:LysM peptidoglycan-binding domain-containing protein [Desulfobacteraceae bacterium]